jgi:hypothetical protein
VWNNFSLQANSFNESIDAVLEWLPLAEEELAFRQIPDNEEDILQLMESHTVRNYV